MKNSGKHYINGIFVDGEGESFVATNPADNSIIWQGANATEAEIKAATDAAHQALPSWAELPIETRKKYLKNFSKLIQEKRENLTKLIALDAGKPLWEAATEVNSVIGKIDLSIKSYEARTNDQKTETANIKSHLSYKPHGVIAVLGPFNFPAHLSNSHIIPALLAGNTIVYKPSELTPLVAQFIMECFDEIKLPKGVLNCVQGNGKSAQMLLKQDIQGVFFTGSYMTGVKINKFFSDKPEIILALEMGGNNPLIIDEIKNIKAAIYQTILSTYITAGQRCTCARRLIIPKNKLGEQFLDEFIKATKNIQVGPYTNKPEPFIGPVISYDHALSHLNAQAQLIASGGKALVPMVLQKENTGLLSPGIIDMSDVSTPKDEEIFAPLVQVYRYDNFEDAIKISNQTKYGLSAGLISDNYDNYRKFHREVRAGLINWNRPTTGAAGDLPFGGIGRSGNHRPSAYFAADYCVYPIASLEEANLDLPNQILGGIKL